MRALNETDFWRELRLSAHQRPAACPGRVRDVVDLVEGAPATLDAILLPKTDSARGRSALDVMLSSLDAGVCGLAPRWIAIEAQIETVLPDGQRGSASPGPVPPASTSPFGPGDYAASIGMPPPAIRRALMPTRRARRLARTGGAVADPGYLPHDAIERIVVAAKAAGLEGAINGPYVRFRVPPCTGAVPKSWTSTWGWTEIGPRT